MGFHPVAEDTADGHETAVKGAVTDGMKRALRSFGDRFGNGLYGDQQPASGSPRPERIPVQPDARANQGRETSSPRQGADRAPGAGVPGDRHDETQLRTLRKRILELGVAQGFDEEQVRAAVRNKTGRDLDELPASELAPLVEIATRKLQQMREAQAA